MSRRFVKFQNFRNIGVTKDKNRFEKLYLNQSLDKKHIWELIILIGENNADKTNVLDALSAVITIQTPYTS